MRKWLVLTVACMLSTSALAIDLGPTCEQAAAKIDADPTVPAATKRHMHANCAKAAVSRACSEKADVRKLSGPARGDFITQCEGHARPAPARRR